MPAPEFTIPKTTAEGQKRSYEIAMGFTTLLEQLNALMPNSRERSIVVTKLQEAHFFAQQANAINNPLEGSS